MKIKKYMPVGFMSVICNGRKNSINMWIGNETMHWDDYIEPATG